MSRPAMRMRSHVNEEEICRGMRGSGELAGIAYGDQTTHGDLLSGGVETYVEIEIGERDGLTVGILCRRCVSQLDSGLIGGRARHGLAIRVAIRIYRSLKDNLAAGLIGFA